MSLQKRYRAIVMEYVTEFCHKQSLNFGYWIDKVGSYFTANEMVIDFNDVMVDIDSRIDPGIYSRFNHYFRISFEDGRNPIGYYEYLKKTNKGKIRLREETFHKIDTLDSITEEDWLNATKHLENGKQKA